MVGATDPIGPAPVLPGAHSPQRAIVARVRWLAVRGGASALVGVIVLGLGGRLVMFASRLLHPDAVGRLTENGNRIGEVTLGGTVALVVFGGLLGGLTAGFVWAIGKPWLPASSLAVGVAATAIGGRSLIAADNVDFLILRDPAVDIALLLGLLFLFGAVLVPVDRWLDRIVPRDGIAVTAVAASMLALALPLSIPIVGGFFSREFCFCDDPPVLTGVLLVVVGLASLTAWTLEARGRGDPPRWLELVATAAMTAAVLAGGAGVATEVVAILG